MLRVTIELVPWDNPDKARHLGTLTISNDGEQGKSADSSLGDYDVTLSKWGRPNAVWRRGRVIGFPRLRLGPFDLLFRALLATVGKRNPTDDPALVSAMVEQYDLLTVDDIFDADQE